MVKYSKDFNIGIIGFGFLGSAISFGFSNYANIKIYDKYKESDSLDDVVSHADILFLCLPTPFYKDDNGRQDISILEESLREISKRVSKGHKIVVIKSTVLPGTNRLFQHKFPNLKFVSNPEFLSASSSRIDFICAARNILGGEIQYVNEVDKLYKHRFGDSLLTFKTTWESAESVKYFCNLFFATKLSFFNYVYSVCRESGINYNEVRDMINSDSRIGRSHDVCPGTDGKFGWGSFCFPKDMLAFINYSRDIGLEPELLKSVWNQNLKDRGEPDWEDLGTSVMTYKYDKDS